MKPTNKKTIFTLESFIILLIASGMIFLINFANSKLNEIFISEQEALLINNVPSNPIHKQLGEEIQYFRPEACKMIEVFSSEFIPEFTVQFDTTSQIPENSIKDYPDLLELFKANSEGHTSITIDDKEEDVYFKWVTTSTNEYYLVIIYMSRHKVENLWVFNFVCYLILILVFILLIRLHIIRHNDHIQYYRSLSDNVRSRLSE